MIGFCHHCLMSHEIYAGCPVVDTSTNTPCAEKATEIARLNALWEAEHATVLRIGAERDRLKAENDTAADTIATWRDQAKAKTETIHELRANLAAHGALADAATVHDESLAPEVACVYEQASGPCCIEPRHRQPITWEYVVKLRADLAAHKDTIRLQDERHDEMKAERDALKALLLEGQRKFIGTYWSAKVDAALKRETEADHD